MCTENKEGDSSQQNTHVLKRRGITQGGPSLDSGKAAAIVTCQGHPTHSKKQGWLKSQISMSRHQRASGPTIETARVSRMVLSGTTTCLLCFHSTRGRAGARTLFLELPLCSQTATMGMTLRIFPLLSVLLPGIKPRPSPLERSFAHHHTTNATLSFVLGRQAFHRWV